MASFRKAKAKANHAIRDKVCHGVARHNNKASGKVHSLGTERGYTQALSGVQSWLDANRSGDVKKITVEKATQYLCERAGVVSQKTLDLDRQALQVVLGEKLERIKASVTFGRLASTSRVYTSEQLRAICQKQRDRYSLGTEIAVSAGLRASELLTILPAQERPASSHREWSSHRFEGREGKLYTVIGKGGLVTEKLVPNDLAERLEARRLEMPQVIRDRGINYTRHYDLAGGKKWSEDFSRASNETLSFSLGGHSARHVFAQQRESELQSRGYSIEEARGIVSQELGHFSPNTTRCYER